jgi:hypothetical protein
LRYAATTPARRSASARRRRRRRRTCPQAGTTLQIPACGRQGHFSATCSSTEGLTPHPISVSIQNIFLAFNSGAPRAKARDSSTCFRGPAFAEAALRRQAEPSEAYPTTLLQSFEGYPLCIHSRSERPCFQRRREKERFLDQGRWGSDVLLRGEGEKC